MTSASEYIGNIKDTVKSFWHGMSITMSHVLRKPITVQYPDRTELPVKDMLPPRYRGFLEVDPSICTGCQACERACPISCIQINLDKDPVNPKQRVVTQFDIDEAKCMFCGLCVEPCPTGSIQHTREFEATQRSVRNLVFRWADALNPFPVYKPQKDAEYFPRAPLGSLVRRFIDARPWDAPGVVFLPPENAMPKKAAAVETKKDEGFGRALELARKIIGKAGDVAAATKVLEEGMAGTDCGACDWPTCNAYAAALASGKEPNPGKCEPGGKESHASAEAVLYTFRSQKLPDVILGKPVGGAPAAAPAPVAVAPIPAPAAAPAAATEEQPALKTAAGSKP
jgi:NADH-quinone oxidoreductase subunit I/NAD(P)H-quinone oxidoreductase subunit I